MTGLIARVRARRPGVVEALPAHGRSAHPAYLYGAVVVVQLAFFLPLAALRVADGDEGFYSLAAAMAADGRIPYEDFLYLQTPLLPYAYGAWTTFFGESWYWLRGLSVLLATLLGVLLYRHVEARFDSRWIGVVAVLLYASSHLVFDWYPLVKTYSLSTLLLFGGYALIAEADSAEGAMADRRRWFLSGALVGLAVDTRLLFAAALPVFAIYALRQASRIGRERLWAAACLAVGFALALLPIAYFLARGPDRFLFDTFEYHQARSGESFIGALGQKLEVVGALFSGEAQFTLLVLAALAAGISLRLVGRRLPLAIATAFALAVVSLLPTPTYEQYMSTLIPFLVVGALELVAVLRSLVPSPAGARLTRVLRRLALVAVVVYLAAAGGGLDDSLSTGKYFRDARLSTVRWVTSTIDAHTRPGDVVLAFWPGHLYESHGEPLGGTENDFAPAAAASAGLSEDRVRRYRMISLREIERAIRSRRARAVVYNPRLGDAATDRDWSRILRESGYRPFERIPQTALGTTLYALPASRAE
jgi:hypothetical protein